MAGVLNVANVGSSIFDSIVDTGTKIFDWVEDNPNVSGAIAGGATALLSYREAKRERDFQRELRQEERDYQSQFGGASTTVAGKGTPSYLTGGGNSLTERQGLTKGAPSMASQFSRG